MRLTAVLFVVLSFAACGASSTTVNKKTAAANTSGPSAAAAETVAIASPDGLKLAGSLFSATKANSPALLLLHQWESDRHSYDEFAKRMQAAGFAVLSIDGRGFGDSTSKTDGTTVAAGRTDSDVKAMLG